MFEIRISTSLLHVQMNDKPHKQEPFIIDLYHIYMPLP